MKQILKLSLLAATGLLKLAQAENPVEAATHDRRSLSDILGGVFSGVTVSEGGGGSDSSHGKEVSFETEHRDPPQYNHDNSYEYNHEDPHGRGRGGGAAATGNVHISILTTTKFETKNEIRTVFAQPQNRTITRERFITVSSPPEIRTEIRRETLTAVETKREIVTKTDVLTATQIKLETIFSTVIQKETVTSPPEIRIETKFETVIVTAPPEIRTVTQKDIITSVQVKLETVIVTAPPEIKTVFATITQDAPACKPTQPPKKEDPWGKYDSQGVCQCSVSILSGRSSGSQPPPDIPVHHPSSGGDCQCSVSVGVNGGSSGLAGHDSGSFGDSRGGYYPNGVPTTFLTRISSSLTTLLAGAAAGSESAETAIGEGDGQISGAARRVLSDPTSAAVSSGSEPTVAVASSEPTAASVDSQPSAASESAAAESQPPAEGAPPAETAAPTFALQDSAAPSPEAAAPAEGAVEGSPAAVPAPSPAGESPPPTPAPDAPPPAEVAATPAADVAVPEAAVPEAAAQVDNAPIDISTFSLQSELNLGSIAMATPAPVK